jgi:hypothetical protein
VIGDYLTEINVTSPTGIREVKRFGGADIAALFWDAVEERLAGRGDDFGAKLLELKGSVPSDVEL